MKKSIGKVGFWLVIIFVIFAGIAFTQNLIDEGEFAFFDREKAEKEEDVALRVNKTTYTFEEFKQTFERVAREIQVQGMEVTKEKVKESTVEMLVQEALLIEHALDEETKVTKEDIDDYIEEIMGMLGLQTEEELLEHLKAEGIEDREELEELLEKEVLVMNLIDAYAENVEITEEQAKEAYDEYIRQVKELGGIEAIEEVPAYEEMEGEIKESLAQEQVHPLIFAKLEEMKEEADIEVFITKESLELEEMESPQQQVPMMDPEDMEGMEIEFEEVE